MNTTPDFDRHASAWLAEGPTELSDRVLDAALREVHLTRQRRRWSTPWRNFPMSLRHSAAALIAIVAVTAVAAYALLGTSIGRPNATVVPTQTAVPTAAGTRNPLLDTSTWKTYVSKRYGLSVAHPADWTVNPGTHDVQADRMAVGTTATETFVAPAGDLRVSAWSIEITPGIGLDVWYSIYCERSTSNSAACIDGRQEGIATTMDGHPGLLYQTPNIQAFFLVENRIYGIAISGAENNPGVARYSGARSLLEAYISTMRLLPEGPYPPLLQAGWTAYDSTQYDFSISHPPGWEEIPASRAWSYEVDGNDWLSPGMDAFVTQDHGGTRVSAWAVAAGPMPDDPTWTDVAAWVEAHCLKINGVPCAATGDPVRLCVEFRDCHPTGLLIESTSEVQAFMTSGIFGDQMVIVSVWWGESEPNTAPYGGSRRLLESFLAAMNVWDERIDRSGALPTAQ